MAQRFKVLLAVCKLDIHNLEFLVLFFVLQDPVHLLGILNGSTHRIVSFIVEASHFFKSYCRGPLLVRVVVMMVMVKYAFAVVSFQ